MLPISSFSGTANDTTPVMRGTSTLSLHQSETVIYTRPRPVREAFVNTKPQGAGKKTKIMMASCCDVSRRRLV